MEKRKNYFLLVSDSNGNFIKKVNVEHGGKLVLDVDGDVYIIKQDVFPIGIRHEPWVISKFDSSTLKIIWTKYASGQGESSRNHYLSCRIYSARPNYYKSGLFVGLQGNKKITSPYLFGLISFPVDCTKWGGCQTEYQLRTHFR
jgi:hypothetical protein